MPDEWTTPAPQAETGQFFRGFSHTQPKEFITSLEEQSCNFRPSGVLFKHRVSPEKIQFPAWFLLPSFPLLEVFLPFVFLWTSYATFSFLLNMLFLFPEKPHSSPSSNSKPANWFILQVTVFVDKHFPNAPKDIWVLLLSVFFYYYNQPPKHFPGY